jgi:AraC-like DNA-binding protein
VCLLAQFIGKLLDSGAALSTSFGLTLAGKSLYSRRSGLIFGLEVLKWHLPTGRRAWRGPGIKAYVRENLLNRRSFENRRNHLQLTTAVRAMFEGPLTTAMLESASTNGSTQAWRITWGSCETEAEPVHDLSTKSDLAAQNSKRSTSEGAGSSTLEPQIRASLARLEGQAVSLKNIALALQISPRTLQRQLAKEGLRFIDIVGTLRAEQAARLLAYSQEPLAQIGFSAGYADQAHFSRDFLRRVGLGPQQYREHALQPKVAKAIEISNGRAEP